MNSYLADLNVWISLAYGRHAHHRAATRWFEGLDDERACFCRITQLGFLRLLTNRKVMGEDVKTQRDAWAVLDKICSDSRVIYVEEPPSVERAYRELTQGSRCEPKVWMDAYLSAFATEMDAVLVTLDRGFQNFPGVYLEVLS